MTDKETKLFVDLIFDKISRANCVSDLEKIENEDFDVSHRMRMSSFPKINFQITPEEIDGLIYSEMLIAENCEFSENITSLITDPLAKILFATCWKNGDLSKIKHIVKGIKDSGTNNEYPESALVFYQFGRFLTKNRFEPIIDQHVIRAWAVRQCDTPELIKNFRKNDTLGKNEIELILSYKAWITENFLTPNLGDSSDFSFMIDKILYATGKKIKTH